jgi:hypothetical protein
MDNAVAEKFCSDFGLTSEQIIRYENDPAADNGLATLFSYIALQDKDDFYKNKTEPFTHRYDIEIYDEIANICNRKDM